MKKISSNVVKLLAFGDTVGHPGRTALKTKLSLVRGEYQPDLIIVNAENASGGTAIAPHTAEEIRGNGVDVITLGDHTWQDKEMPKFFDTDPEWCIRPANYPVGAPGRGWTMWSNKTGINVAVINLLGRTFINGPLDCPFQTVNRILDEIGAATKIIVLDMHAEATSEKQAIAHFLDGRVSLVYGTHTHVQTADEKILPNGTAFISDIGMCGPMDGVLGMRKENSIRRFLGGLKVGYEVSPGEGMLNGISCEIDASTGRAIKIERISNR